MIVAQYNKKNFDKIELNRIYDMYKNQNMNTLEISERFNVSKTPISRILKQANLLKRGVSDGIKIRLNEEEKEKIRELYLIENKNCKYIGSIMNLKPSFIDKYLSTCNYRRSKSEATKISVTGRKVSQKAVENMKIGQRNLVLSGKRKQTGGVCKNFMVCGLICQGISEKLYIEHLIKNDTTLPRMGGIINTPFGGYYPDFVYDDKLIEVKSSYTYDVLYGIKKSRWTNKFEHKQLQKIKWVNENIIPIEIVVIDKNNSIKIKSL